MRDYTGTHARMHTHTHTHHHTYCVFMRARVTYQHTRTHHTHARARAPSSARAGAKPRHRIALYGRMADGGGQRTGSGSSPPSAAKRPAAKSTVITRRSGLASHAATRPPDGSTHHGAVPRTARDPTWQSCPRSATQCDSHPPRPLCRLQRSGDSGLAMRCNIRVGIAAPAPKQIILHTHRPPTVDQISVLPHARPSGNVNGSQPTVTIADKYKSRRSHRDLRTTLWRAEMKRCPRGCNSIRSCR